ncbi:preprotein translocase subunit SecG [Luteimonas notoginsengisoli]|uniref:Protein-export membrane protein SecG n=1 Tax=Luteimonas notoginsengisoli TaxID=1578200 RepID=A0ABV7USE4_9GAMM
MLMSILNVFFVLIAIAMIALILMQRGAGAQAGSGFGGGASATVFGAQGSSNFLSKATKWLAIAFFAITLFMAWHATHSAQPGAAQQDLGVMSQAPAAPAPAGDLAVPAAPSPAVPSAPAQPADTTPAQTQSQPPAQTQPVPQGD